MINNDLTVGMSSSPGSRYKGMSADDFLSLMIEEIKHQDPLNPSSTSEELQKMSEIGSVQSLTEIRNLMRSELTTQNVATAVGMIGRSVTVGGQERSGRVNSVSAQGSQVMLHFENGEMIPFLQEKSIIIHE